MTENDTNVYQWVKNAPFWVKNDHTFFVSKPRDTAERLEKRNAVAGKIEIKWNFHQQVDFEVSTPVKTDLICWISIYYAIKVIYIELYRVISLFGQFWPFFLLFKPLRQVFYKRHYYSVIYMIYYIKYNRDDIWAYYVVVLKLLTFWSNDVKVL